MDRKFGVAALVVVVVLSGEGYAIPATRALNTLPANKWVRVGEGATGKRVGSVLVYIPDLEKMLLLGGIVRGAPYVQAFDPARRTWSGFLATAPVKDRPGMHPYYQTAYDPVTRTLYCMSAGPLYALDIEKRTWRNFSRDPALEGLSWHTLAIDPQARKLVVVGADKKVDNLGWSRTVVLDLTTGKWSRLPLPPAPVVREHRQLVAAREATIDLVGRIRMAWYRDPEGVGSEAELAALEERLAALRKMPAMTRFADHCDSVGRLLAARRTLEALKAARAMQRALEEFAEAQYPVPTSRRNSPLVFDLKHRLFVLFGGDHEDYLMNDTWVLDLKEGWRRVEPTLAPSPRAGHAFLYLPGSGKLAMLGGYLQNSSRDYGARAWKTLEPRQLWVYDAGAQRWDLVTTWRPKRGDPSIPAAAGTFYPYRCEYYSPLAVAADENDLLVLETRAGKRGRSSTWLMRVDLNQLDTVGREKLAWKPNSRRYRTGFFVAAYGEVPARPQPTNIDHLPPNRWVALPPVPRNFATGCRQRDWGTAVWDPINEEIVLWGGGHCVHSCSTPLHYSPLGGRMVEGYDADEPYNRSGGGGFGSSVLNRPWVPVHGYNLYAYDPPSRLIVTATGFLYDPLRMDWLRMEPMERPFKFIWSSTVLETSPHGVVAWARYRDRDQYSLFLFRWRKGWEDLKPKGKLFRPYCDSEGMTYDTKRDRMLLGWGGGYAKRGDGSIWAFNFKTRTLTKLTPANAHLGRIANTREMVYLDHADWVVFAEPYIVGTGKEAKRYLRVYDCAANRYFLLDTGQHPSTGKVHSQGWCYDAKRKLIYVITNRGRVYALRLDPQSARRIENP